MDERKPRILYVDANQDNCEFVMRDLTDYEVTCAGAAEDALLLGKSGSFDLILLDDRLPGATGIELCQELRAHDRVIPILILSGPDDEAMRKRAREAGAQDYWPTPVDLEAVGQELRRLLPVAMRAKQRQQQIGSAREERRDSGLPGGGRGCQDVIGRTGVYPVSASSGASPAARVEGEMSWGQGKRGAEGYYDHGDSGLTPSAQQKDQAGEKRPISRGRVAGRK